MVEIIGWQKGRRLRGMLDAETKKNKLKCSVFKLVKKVPIKADTDKKLAHGYLGNDCTGD